MNKDLLLRYAWLKTEIKKLESEEDMIHDQVEQEVIAAIGDTDQNLALAEYPGYTFILAKARPKWDYTANVKIQETALKELKTIEEQTGKAKNLNDGLRELRFQQPREGK